MVFVNSRVLLPLLAALAVLAAPADNTNPSASSANHTVNADADLLNIPPVVLLASITPIASTQVNAYTPYTYYASAGYCNPSVTKTWTCGADCNANPGFQPIASGGDGSSTQFCSWPFLRLHVESYTHCRTD